MRVQKEQEISAIMGGDRSEGNMYRMWDGEEGYRNESLRREDIIERRKVNGSMMEGEEKGEKKAEDES